MQPSLSCSQENPWHCDVNHVWRSHQVKEHSSIRMGSNGLRVEAASQYARDEHLFVIRFINYRASFSLWIFPQVCTSNKSFASLFPSKQPLATHRAAEINSAFFRANFCVNFIIYSEAVNAALLFSGYFRSAFTGKRMEGEEFRRTKDTSWKGFRAETSNKDFRRWKLGQTRYFVVRREFSAQKFSHQIIIPSICRWFQRSNM